MAKPVTKSDSELFLLLLLAGGLMGEMLHVDAISISDSFACTLLFYREPQQLAILTITDNCLYILNSFL